MNGAPSWARALSAFAGLALCAGLLALGVTTEVPRGAITGKVTMRENGKPLSSATLIIRPAFELADAMPRARYPEIAPDGTFRVDSLPAGKYTVEAMASAHEFDETTVDVAEAAGGQATTMNVVMRPREPFLDLYINQHVYLPRESIKFQATGMTSSGDVTVDLLKVTPSFVSSFHSIGEALRNLRGIADPEKMFPGRVSKQTPIRRKLTTLDVEGVFREPIVLDGVGKGLYAVRVSSGGKSSLSYIQVTDMALVTKRAGRRLLGYVTNLDSGTPIAGATVSAFVNGKSQSSGVTSAEGLVDLTIPERPEKDRSGYNPLVFASKGDSQAFIDLYVYDRAEGESIRQYVYTDRPIYRPGDTVHFKGIVRSVAESGLELAKPQEVEAELRDQDENVLAKQKITLRPSGSFDGLFDLDPALAPGGFTIISRVAGDEFRHYFTIAAYRKPEIQIRMEPTQPKFVIGDKAKVQLTASYYFGGPVPDAEVNVSIFRSADYGWFSNDEGGEYVGDFQGRTDESGKLIIEFDTKPSEESPRTPEDDWRPRYSDWSYKVMAYLSEGNQSVDSEVQVPVARGEIGLKSTLDRYIADPTEPVSLELETTNLLGKPAPGIQIDVEVAEELWQNTKMKLIRHDLIKAVTNQDGKAEVAWKPTFRGSVTFISKVKDSRGNLVENRDYVYVTGAGQSWPSTVGPELKVTASKDKYAIGETARVMIETKSPGGTALLTIEAEKIYVHKIVQLKSNVTIVDLPIEDRYQPNVYCSVVYVHNKQFSSGTAELNVTAGRHELQVTVSSDKERYQPGDVAQYTVQVHDESGKPVKAEVSLGVVDEAIYAIREDSTDVMDGMFPTRNNSIETNYSFVELYLDGGDKAPANIEIRKVFKDTAAWIPVVETNDQGVAVVAVKLPDNLTSWRATAVAAAGSDAFGMAKGNCRVSLPLMARFQVPAFLTQGDRITVATVVTNDSGADQEVQVRLDVEGVTFQSDATQKVQVADRKSETVRWLVSADKPGQARFTVRAWTAGGLSDGMQKSCPVAPYGIWSDAFQSGLLQPSTPFTMALPPSADRNLGALKIDVYPDLFAAAAGSLDELIDYPYGCVEQTMSRFLPVVVLTQLAKESKLQLPARASEIPRMVREGYLRLQSMQSYQGGWGWWRHDECDPFMTAYVLEGIYFAAKAGYPAKYLNLKRALDWADQYLKTPKQDDENGWRPSESERLYLAYALALHQRKNRFDDVLKTFDWAKAEATDLTLVALGAQALGKEYAATAKRAVDALISKAQVTENQVKFSSDWHENETAGRALQAMSVQDPKSPLLSKVIYRLMLNRRGNGWMSTRDTSFALLGLATYLKATGTAGTPSSSIAVLVNGVERGRWTPADKNGSKPFIVTVPASELIQGDNRVELRLNQGRIGFYSASLRTFEPKTTLEPATYDPNLKVTKAYHRLVVQTLEDGTKRLLPSKEPVTTVKKGDVVRVVIEVDATKPLEYMMVEDPLLSSCKVLEQFNPQYESDWTWWWSDATVFDNRIVFFSRNMPAGKSTLEYTLRAEADGDARTSGTMVKNMYDPSVWARSGGISLKVNP